MNQHGRNQRAIEVAKRRANGELLNDLAREYEVTPVTIWRWDNEGTRSLLPATEEREQWRNEVIPAITNRLVAALDRGDDDIALKAVDRLAKILGLNHADMLSDAYLKIETRKLDMIATALERAADRAGLGIDQRIDLGHALDEELAALEATPLDAAS